MISPMTPTSKKARQSGPDILFHISTYFVCFDMKMRPTFPMENVRNRSVPRVLELRVRP